MNKSNKFEISYERLLFFSDAVVAIAITLLALDLKLEIPDGQLLSYSDFLKPWHLYAGFILSFIHIAGFWSTHHRMFGYINKMDIPLKGINTFWLFFIVILPFTTTILSKHFNSSAGVFFYATNVLLISIFQLWIWLYADKQHFIKVENEGAEGNSRLKLMLIFEIVNAIIAVVVSIFAPITAFVLLFFKIPILFMGSIYIASLKKQAKGKRKDNK